MLTFITIMALISAADADSFPANRKDRVLFAAENVNLRGENES